MFRYVADLFKRLQRAEWALGTARRRAATWGFGLLVPEGRCDRGIQTHPAEVWAAEERHSSPLKAEAIACMLPALAPRVRASSAGAAVSAAPLAALSANTLKASLSEVPGFGSSFGTAPGSPKSSPGGPSSSPTASAWAVRTRPAFTDNSGGVLAAFTTAVDEGQGKHQGVSSAAAPGSDDMQQRALTASNWRWVVARRLLAAASSSPATPVLPPLLSPRDLLCLVSEILSAKANADAAALRSRLQSQPSDLITFVFSHMAKRAATNQPPVPLMDSLTQLVASLRAVSRGGSSGSSAASDVAWFAKALGCAQPLEELAAVRSPASSAPPCASSSATAWSTEQQGTGCLQIAGSNRRRVRFPTLPAAVLVPPDLAAAAQQLAMWPGMGALLGWVAAGSFLGRIAPEALGRPLMDVQAPQFHLLLREACDILGLSEPPRVHILQQSLPSVHLLTVPDAWSVPPSTLQSSKLRSDGTTGGRAASTFAWRRQGLIVVSSGALGSLGPLELQAALGAALLPLRAPGELW